MPSRDQLLPMVRDGCSYEEIGHRFGIPAGQAYMIVTGLPADGSDVLEAEALAAREGLLTSSSQHLVNPPAEVPSRDAETLRWLRRRAAEDAPMRQAAARRTVQPPQPDPDDGTDDVLSALTRQHDRIRMLQEQLETLPSAQSGGTADERRQRVAVVAEVRERFARHKEAVERCLWPVVARALTDGEQLAEQGRGQELRTKAVLDSLQGLAGDDERFDDLVRQLGPALRRHMAFEETVFLRLEQAVPAAEREELGRRIPRDRSDDGVSPGHQEGAPRE
ncbi:hemerythrin domain-containing protein [Streptomyces sp. NPDC053499]|uniref:hemerythrin domain-containing protein n=1 Tax=Streptomyces sp. NPDC053499 TaxID=3365707 RepID=UPI0037D18739